MFILIAGRHLFQELVNFREEVANFEREKAEELKRVEKYSLEESAKLKWELMKALFQSYFVNPEIPNPGMIFSSCWCFFFLTSKTKGIMGSTSTFSWQLLYRGSSGPATSYLLAHWDIIWARKYFTISSKNGPFSISLKKKFAVVVGHFFVKKATLQNDFQLQKCKKRVLTCTKLRFCKFAIFASLKLTKNANFPPFAQVFLQISFQNKLVDG